MVLKDATPSTHLCAKAEKKLKRKHQTIHDPNKEKNKTTQCVSNYRKKKQVCLNTHLRPYGVLIIECCKRA